MDEIVVYFEAQLEDPLGRGLEMLSRSTPVTSIETLDAALDSAYSNFKMDLLSALRRDHPTFWHKSSPIQHDNLSTLHINV